MAGKPLQEILAESTSTIERNFDGMENSIELRARVEEIIPLDADSYEIVKVKGVPTKFKASLACHFSR